MQRKFVNSRYNRVIETNTFYKYESLLNIYVLKRIISGDKILTLYFLLIFSRIKLTVVLLWIVFVSVYPLSKLETFVPLTSIMSQDLALQRGASRLQTASANLWTFSLNITSPLSMHFPLLNPTELPQYRVVLFYWLVSNFSLVLVLVLVLLLVLVLALVWLLLCTPSVLACNRPIAVGSHSDKGIELK
jgi:hypothetical protein